MGLQWFMPAGERITAQARRFLGAWQIDFAHDGELRLKPLKPDLGYADLFELVERLLVSGVAEDAALVFDCSELRSIQDPWTAVFALWLHLARYATRGCRLVGLQGQPAAMAALALRGVPPSLIHVEFALERDAA